MSKYQRKLLTIFHHINRVDRRAAQLDCENQQQFRLINYITPRAPLITHMTISHFRFYCVSHTVYVRVRVHFVVCIFQKQQNN